VKMLLVPIMFFPLFGFCVAAVNELRSPGGRVQKVRSLTPIVLGIAAFALSLNPQALLHVAPDSSVTLSRVMTMFSALIACSGVFVTYARRSSAIWVACGGLVLALGWMFERVVV